MLGLTMDRLPWILILILVVNLHLLQGSSSEAKILGFSAKIIHRDSALSPFYDHSITSGELARKAARHSIARSASFSSSFAEESKIVSKVFPNGGSYVMEISFGTPPIKFYAIADTGSDLVWLQCEPCDYCYPQDQPPFDPSQSSTFAGVSCSTNACLVLPRSACNTRSECVYQYTYGDGSVTIGVLSSDTFTFDAGNGDAVAFPESLFGCGLHNKGTFNKRDSGLVGLGGGPLSLISQLDNQIGGKFSYCLLPREANSSSNLNFGTNAVLLGSNVVSTPLLSKDAKTFYYLTLEGATVGDQRISNDKVTSVEGNIIIDSGTTLNVLEPSFYNKLEALVKEAIALSTVEDPYGEFAFCYESDSFSLAPAVPIVFHFTGADLTLNTENTFLMLDNVTCFAMIPTNDVCIYGNVAQVNFQVAYDLVGKQVSFAPAVCDSV